MFKNIMEISVKLFARYKLRYIFIIISLTIAATFIIFLVGSASMIDGILYDMSSNRSTNEKQLRVEMAEERMTQEDISDFVNKVKPHQIRIECKALYTKAKLVINDIEYANVSICVYDGEHTFITDNEIKNAMISVDAVKNTKMGICISESFLDENNIEKISIEKSKLKLDIINDNGEIGSKLFSINNVLSASTVSCMNTKVKCDIYISNKVFDDSVITYPASCILEFNTYDDAMKAYELLENDKYIVTKYDEHILDAKSEAIIYQTIFYIVTGVVVITVIGCIFCYMNINTEEHKVFWGILKSVGYRKIHIYIMCIIQSIFIGVTGIFFAVFLALCIGDFLIKELIGSIMINKSLDSNYMLVMDTNTLFIAIFIILISCILGAIVPAIRITNKSSMYLLEDVRE